MSMNDAQRDPVASNADSDSEAARAALKMARRRRLIRLGASSVPVTLTLASRPVMAWHCYTTSAWGSTIQANQVASVAARLNNSRSDGNECWYISNWCNNTMYSPAHGSYKPWRVLAESRYSGITGWASMTDTQKCDHAKANCTLGNIFPNGCGAVGNSGDKVFAKLTGGDAFTKSVITARLNQLYTNVNAKLVIDKCVVVNYQDQIQQMAKLGSSYSSPNAPTVLWTKSQIVTYLSSSYLAV